MTLFINIARELDQVFTRNPKLVGKVPRIEILSRSMRPAIFFDEKFVIVCTHEDIW